MPNELNLSQNIEVLKVKIEDKEYSVPLASSLPYKKARELAKVVKKGDDEAMDAFLAFFGEHIPSEVLDNLPMSALTTLVKAWAGKNDDEGTSLGE